MKRLVQVQEIEWEGGLESLLGEQVVLFCVNYIYAGKLVGVSDRFALLEDGGIVYETGAFAASAWKDFQKIGQPLYVTTNLIESFARGK